MRLFCALLVLLCSACSLTEFAANGVVNMTAQAAPAVQEHWDWELARDTIPSGIARLEGMFRVVPDNEDLLLQLVRAYAAWGFGFLEDDMEEAEMNGDWDRADRLRMRAHHAYQRAVMFVKRLFRMRDESFDSVLTEGPEAFEAWVDEQFDDEEDVELAFWSGYAWGLMIRSDDPSALVDLPVARALVDKSVELDPSYFHYAGMTFQAAIAGSIPAQMGGDPEHAKALFERVLELTDRRALSVQLNYARTVAVNTNDRELYVRLLEEVLAAGDVLPDARLANKIARRRAARSLRRTDELFY